jgi:hypothetical protein
MPLDHWLRKSLAVPTREPGFLRNSRFKLETIERATAAEAPLKNSQVIILTDFDDGAGQEDDVLGAWCCVMQEDKAMIALYDWSRPLQLAPAESHPDKLPGSP